MASGKLTPLGDPAPNAPKWFAAMEVIGLAAGNGPDDTGSNRLMFEFQKTPDVNRRA